MSYIWRFAFALTLGRDLAETRKSAVHGSCMATCAQSGVIALQLYTQTVSQASLSLTQPGEHGKYSLYCTEISAEWRTNGVKMLWAIEGRCGTFWSLVEVYQNLLV